MNTFVCSIASISIFLISNFLPISGQQPYIRRSANACNTKDPSTSALGYTCNGLKPRCRSYLTFRSHPPYDSISAISTLLSTSPSQLARVNSLPENATLDTNRLLLVPLKCSCSGHHYQANTTYTINHHDTYFLIANNTFQGLSTCQAIKSQNGNLTGSLYSGEAITVPLRCACPTKNQTYDGVKYLLTYLVTWGQYVSSISQLFKVSTSSSLAANGLSEEDHTIYPFTTLLIPLKNPPLISQVPFTQPPPRSLNPPPSTPPSSGGSRKPWLYAVVGVVSGLVLASTIAAFVFYFFFVKQRQKTEPAIRPVSKEVDEGVHAHSHGLISLGLIPQTTKVYTIEELKTATQDFNPSFLIKGSVYRGTINGDYAAIKKMSGDVSEEIKILDKLNHFNLIRLSGACFDKGFWYFIYEYAANGSLSDWIHRSNGEKRLSWRERLQIALDAASGLNYLHSYTSPPLVHKDINSSNVLLDRDLRGKLTNFGLARSVEGHDGHFAFTNHIVGRQGYLAPEYLENGLVSPMVDVYAFGILMLEILTGKEASNLQLSDLLLPLLQEEEEEEGRKEKLDNLLDPFLHGNYPSLIAVLLLELIRKCLENDPSDRPSTEDIVHSLSRILIFCNEDLEKNEN